jgi:hypothetical protein
MKGASLLREAMWSMTSELHLTVGFDDQAYTAENLAASRRRMSPSARPEERRPCAQHGAAGIVQGDRVGVADQIPELRRLAAATDAKEHQEDLADGRIDA